MERFFDKILKTESCWIWTGGSRGNGYGAFKLNGKVVDAHRVSYMIHKGDIPDHKLICHTCDNRSCVNPDHLFIGTHSDNMQDCKSKGRLVVPDNTHLLRHPSSSSYKKGCRCDGCKAVEAGRRRIQRLKKREITQSPC